MEYNNYADAINDLLSCAYKFDDKPHQLYSCIRKIALQYTKGSMQEEIVRLMDEAYSEK